MKKICFVFLLLLTLIPLGVSAQQQMIQGRVLDDKGESIMAHLFPLEVQLPVALLIWTVSFPLPAKWGIC